MLAAARDSLRALGGERKPIAIMDSGVGGLPYLESIRRLLPGERFAYLADRAGFPYGTKDREEIEAIVLDRIGRLVDAFDPAIVVIACNTASQAALAAARAAHPGLSIVGTVPAVKPAAERTRTGVVGVMATEHAIGDPYLDELVARHASGVKVVREAAQDLVAFVERDFVRSTAAARRAAVEAYVRRLVDAGADEIVLACTHFLHVAEDIGAAAEALALESGRAARVEVIDSREGVARRVADLLAVRTAGASVGAEKPVDPSRSVAGLSSRPADGVFLLSGPPPFEDGYEAFAGRYGLLGPFSLEGEAG